MKRWNRFKDERYGADQSGYSSISWLHVTTTGILQFKYTKYDSAINKLNNHQTKVQGKIN